ncbi:hypothetical protein [Dyadobacter diqingensis]|nr:hypothetical protein [Dyadobacter diqingensis]
MERTSEAIGFQNEKLFIPFQLWHVDLGMIADTSSGKVPFPYWILNWG